MDTEQRVVNPDSRRGLGYDRRRVSGSLVVLVTIDVLAFAAAVWLALGMPEAFDAAASSANAGAALASGNPASHLRQRLNADLQEIDLATF